MAKTNDGMKIIDNMIKDDAKMRLMCFQATLCAHVAQSIYDARMEAGLSQKELAQMIGTTQSVISRLEDADYEGHSLSMLSRIALALNREVKIELVRATSNEAEECTKEVAHMAND
jgi:ribosome-binding protein aMBF1 (putative translation factor)